jgi:penicillin amidase
MMLGLSVGVSSLAMAPAMAKAKTSAPPAQTRVVAEGLKAPAEILIDRWGVPHIFAASAHDAFFAQGWNAARDRLWQIDLWRRSGLGQMAAVLGSSSVAQDRATRLFVYRGDMNKEWQAYGADARSHIEAFVAGINAYVTAAKHDATLMPKEFKLAGYEPALWQAEDVVRVRNHGLVSGAIAEVERAQILCKADFTAADLLRKIEPQWTPIVPEGLDPCSIPANVLDQYRLAQKAVSFDQGSLHTSTSARLDAEEVADNDQSVRSQGSNNWAISPARSATGRPILANDPHRSYEVPSLRYIAHLVAPGLNVIGAGEPALPGISIGHNDRSGFGLTVFPIAQEDLYVYETNPLNSNEYRYQGKWEAMHVLHESIAVRGAPDSDAELKFTRHGPVVMEDAAHHRAYAVRVAWLDTGAAPYLASLRYLQAQNVQQFSAALKFWGEPSENMVYADTSGKIAWFPVGYTPIRPNTDGILPLPGDGRYEWNGYLDRDQLPAEVDPERGYIATANQLNLPKDFPYKQRRVGFAWSDPARFDRINEVISALPKVSLQDSEKLQNDYVSLPARRLIQVLGAIATQDHRMQDTVHWLQAWDKRVTTTSPQAALYEVWVAHHLGAAVTAKAIPAVPESIREPISGSARTIVDLLEHPDQRLGSNPQQTRDELMLQSLAAAVDETVQRLGPDRSAWQWGKLSTALFEHALAGLADEDQRHTLNVGPQPKAGDGNVVGAAGYRSKDFRLREGAAFRMVLDVGNWDDSVAVNSPGQSGEPSSPHYRDLFALWLAGEYFPLVYSRAAIEKATEQKIVLAPR